MGKTVKKIVVLAILAVPFAFWLNKVMTVVEVEQRNDRIEINNAVVRILNEMQAPMEETHRFFERFLSLDQLTESQERGTWYLLDLMDCDYQEEIDAAKNELSMVFHESAEEDKALLMPAMQVLDSYSNYGAVHEDIVLTIKSRELSELELQMLLGRRFQELESLTAEAVDNFESVQQDYVYER